MIILLNLLIAVISDTYEKILSSEAAAFNYERMQIIYLID